MFTSDQICSRGQIFTFLYRFYGKPPDNSELIGSLRSPSTPSTPSTPADVMELDPLPPENYKKQVDRYMSMTRRDTMSNARLVAEYKQIEAVNDDFRAWDIFITDSIYTRENNLWSEVSLQAYK